MKKILFIIMSFLIVNVTFAFEMTDELYKDYVEANKTLDFSITNFGFISQDQQYGMYTLLEK